MVRLFDLEAGERVELVIECIGVHRDDGGVTVDRTVRVKATATDEYQEIAGTRRRRFTDFARPSIAPAPTCRWPTPRQTRNYGFATCRRTDNR